MNRDIDNYMVQDAFEDLPEVDEDAAYEEARQNDIDEARS
jgi:hypothetical protein